MPSSAGAPSFVSIRVVLADISPSRETLRCQPLSESQTKELPYTVLHLTIASLDSMHGFKFLAEIKEVSVSRNYTVVFFFVDLPGFGRQE